jgi:cysteine synthase A
MSSVVELIGNTPLVKLKQVSRDLECEVFAKCEFLNPAGSIKDRVALYMVKDALRAGEIKGIVEPTSGNTGIGLALVCSALGIPLIITMPESMSFERRATIEHFGAELILTSSEDGMQGAIDMALEVSKNRGFKLLNQFENPSNPKAHYETTAPEIYSQKSDIDIFVSGIGTGGTITGVSKFLKDRVKDIKIYGIEPEESAVINRGERGVHQIEGIGAGFIPKNLDLELIDEVLEVSSKEAIAEAKRVSKEGLFVGISSGANIAGIYKLSTKMDIKGKKIVTILHDSASRYISTALFE